MPTPIPMRFQAGSLSVGTRQTKQEFYDEMAEKLIAYWEGSIGFVNGGPEPTSDQGPWLRNGNEWRFWNPATGSYSLGVFQAGDIMPTGNAVVDESTGWLPCDGNSVAVDAYPLLFAAIGYIYGGAGAFFNTPNPQGRVFVGLGTGAGLTTRNMGEIFGVESVALVAAENGTHNHTAGLEGSFGFANGAYERPICSTGTNPVVNTGDSGASTPHQNMQPSLVCAFKIKY